MAKRPSFKGRKPASVGASTAARGASKKQDTRHEIKLRQALWALGLRYRKNVAHLPGKPDIVFAGARVIVFCDGDFWHGRDWEARKQRLSAGHNAPYWLAKIERNMERDRERTLEFESKGWLVMRFWETDIARNAPIIAKTIADAVANRRTGVKALTPPAARQRSDATTVHR